jgi:hypothetical protein
MISPTKYDVSRNLIGLPGVIKVYDNKPLNPEISYQTNSVIFEALQPLLDRGWKFFPRDTKTTMDRIEGKPVHVVNSWTIYDADEKLGSVGLLSMYSRVSAMREYRIYVENERISDARRTGRVYRTSDPKKATLMIRKNFYRKPDAEKVEAQWKDISNQLNSANWDTVAELQRAKKKFFNKAEDFVLSNMDLYVQQHPSAIAAREEVDKTMLDHKTVSGICKLYEAKKIILVLRDGARYIVKVDGRMYTITDDDMTEDMRRKLGLLKLVEDGQCIEGIGFKGGENSFLITPEVAE